MKWLLLVALLLVCASSARAQSATLVAADTGGLFFHRGADSLWVRNTTWIGRDSAPAASDCVYSGASRRMLARDSVRITIYGAIGEEWWSAVLVPGETKMPHTTLMLTTGALSLIDVSAPNSPCGVNAGQIWFHWRFIPFPPTLRGRRA